MIAHGVKAEQPVWDLRGTDLWKDEFVISSHAFERVLSLPLYPDLTDFEQKMVCTALRRCLEDGE
jgi:dTDP-4-amino-4,6-dideoxygalactose transaminase